MKDTFSILRISRVIPGGWLASTFAICALALGFIHTGDSVTAATITYTGRAEGAVSGNWLVTTNWSPAIVPTAEDDVIINEGLVVLPANPAFATLTLSPTASISGTFTNRGVIHWKGGMITAEITIAAGAVLELSGPDQKFLEESTINNSGTIRWRDTGGIQSSTPLVINNLAGGLFLAESDSSILQASFTAPAVFNNQGTFRKSGGNDKTAIERVVFNNSGKIELQTGTLHFPDGLNHSGTIEVSEGASLDLAGGKVTFHPGSSITGAGFYGITGMVEVEGTINSQNFQLVGDLKGTNVLTGRMVWPKGKIQGDLTIASSGVLELTGVDQKNLEEAAIHNSGTIRWRDAGGIQSSTEIVINNLAGGLFLAESDSSILQASFTAPAVFNNQGTFRKNGGNGKTAIERVVFNNSGKIETQTGTLHFPDGFNHSGTIEVSEGARLELFGGTVTFHPGSSITGAGFYGITGMVEVEGTINSQNFQLVGDLKGTNALTGRMVWPKGKIQGDLTIASGGVLELTGDDQKNLEEAAIHNSGTIRWRDTGGIQSSTAIVINNLQGGVFQAENDSAILHSSFSAPAIFVNDGEFRKRGTKGITAIQNVSFHNRGKVEIETGALDFSGGYSQSAGATILHGTRLKSEGLIHIEGGALSGAGILEGNLENSGQLNPASLVLLGDYKQTAAGNINLRIGGISLGAYDTLSIAGKATLEGVLNVSFTGGFRPVAGNSFSVISFVNRSGSFAQMNGLDLGGGVQLSADFKPTSLTLSIPSPFTVERTDSGVFNVQFEGEPGVLYLLEASDNLVDWEVVTPVLQNGGVVFADASAVNTPKRFYRVRTP